MDVADNNKARIFKIKLQDIGIISGLQLLIYQSRWGHSLYIMSAAIVNSIKALFLNVEASISYFNKVGERQIWN